MEIESTKIEVIKVESGISLNLTTDEAKIILAALGKAKTTDIRSYTDTTFNPKVPNVETTAYRLYNELYDFLLDVRK